MDLFAKIKAARAGAAPETVAVKPANSTPTVAEPETVAVPKTLGFPRRAAANITTSEPQITPQVTTERQAAASTITNAGNAEPEAEPAPDDDFDLAALLDGDHSGLDLSDEDEPQEVEEHHEPEPTPEPARPAPAVVPPAKPAGLVLPGRRPVGGAAATGNRAGAPAVDRVQPSGPIRRVAPAGGLAAPAPAHGANVGAGAVRARVAVAEPVAESAEPPLGSTVKEHKGITLPPGSALARLAARAPAEVLATPVRTSTTVGPSSMAAVNSIPCYSPEEFLAEWPEGEGIDDPDELQALTVERHALLKKVCDRLDQIFTDELAGLRTQDASEFAVREMSQIVKLVFMRVKNAQSAYAMLDLEDRAKLVKGMIAMKEKRQSAVKGRKPKEAAALSASLNDIHTPEVDEAASVLAEFGFDLGDF